MATDSAGLYTVITNKATNWKYQHKQHKKMVGLNFKIDAVRTAWFGGKPYLDIVSGQQDNYFDLSIVSKQ